MIEDNETMKLALAIGSLGIPSEPKRAERGVRVMATMGRETIYNEYTKSYMAMTWFDGERYCMTAKHVMEQNGRPITEFKIEDPPEFTFRSMDELLGRLAHFKEVWDSYHIMTI